MKGRIPDLVVIFFIVASFFVSVVTVSKEFPTRTKSENHAFADKTAKDFAVSNIVSTAKAAAQPDIQINASELVEKEEIKKPQQQSTSSAATKLSIPSINLDARVIPVGIDSLGNMDVPSGSSNDVGWYKYGPVPGEMGSAVFDAHVYAAFENLNKVRVDDDIYVTDKNGKKLHFKVESAKTYLLENLSPATLFDKNDKRRLNLITCAGELTPDRSTYTHRLIVFAVLVD